MEDYLFLASRSQCCYCIMLVMIIYVTFISNFCSHFSQRLNERSVSGCLGESVSVSCSHQTICALQESAVNLICSYPNIAIRTVFWFSFKQKAKWRNETHPEDLALDSDYAGRVSAESTDSKSTLTIKDLRVRDSGDYHLMIITEQGEKHLSISTAVSLTVTDLQVKKQTNSLTCSTSCALPAPARQRYFWYKNGQFTGKYTDYHDPFPLSSDGDDKGSYSCSVYGYNSIRSSPLCVSDGNCWNVTYTDRRVCVLEGSSVDFPCTYTCPSNYHLNNIFWHYDRSKKEEMDLRGEQQFAGRVEFIGAAGRNCTLRINNLRERDSGDYYFRIITNIETGKFSGRPGIIVNVTALQVRVISSTVLDDQTVTLMCSSTCTLPNNPTYMWYKNGQPVTNKHTRDNKLYLKCSEDTGSYSCAVRGHEELRSPDQTLSDCLGGPEMSKNAMVGATVGASLFLVLILIIAALWMWRRKSRPAKDHGGPRQSSQDILHYSSIHFSHSCTEESESSRSPRDNTELVQYAAVKFKR
ncbi:uncharacterized protein LOC108436608 isoform X1 [Pygocentrus nattereri]|uniref:uncharacterized protein LOC108436608 isoform X1 n=1 Tax=Pygocentrus nattereri TaxID=42514 RepID=UPI001891A135|nr:uncharacterized protein LOC108436608 isoform X1 [Pygocentrus nattereri]